MKRLVVTGSQLVFWLSSKISQPDHVWVKTLRTANRGLVAPFLVRSSCRFFAGLATGLLNTSYICALGETVAHILGLLNTHS